MRTSARFFLGLVVAALVALGLVVLLSASQPASRQALRYSRNKAVEALSASLAHAQARMQRAAPEEYESTRLEVSRLEKELLSLKARPLSPYFFWKKQLVFCLIGLVLAVLVARFDYHRWRDWNLATVLFVFEIALLLAVFFFPEHKGSRRWISLGFADLQPSEFAKIVVVLVLSVWMDKASWRVERFVRGAVMPALIIAALIVPILFEPDFGSSMVIALAGGLVMIVAGTRWRYIVPMGIFGMLAIATLILSNPNRRERLFVQYGHLLDSKDNAATTQCVPPSGNSAGGRSSSSGHVRDDGYQVRQSLLAIQRGGVSGVGLYKSMQKERYLPENHTDFIFAIGAEELGVFLSVGTIALFLVFFALSVVIARNSEDRLGRFIALGSGFIITFQAFFNLGVITGIYPTKGMALPFFSYGGTSMLSSFIVVGLIFSVANYGCKSRSRQFPAKLLMRGRG